MEERTNYELFCKEAPIGLFKTKQDDDVIVYINAHGAAILGYSSPDELIGTKASDIYDSCEYQELLEKLYIGHVVTDCEMKMNRKDGRNFYASISARNGNNYIMGSMLDITGRKNLERQIDELRQREMQSLVTITKSAKLRLSTP